MQVNYERSFMIVYSSEDILTFEILIVWILCSLCNLGNFVEVETTLFLVAYIRVVK